VLSKPQYVSKYFNKQIIGRIIETSQKKIYYSGEIIKSISQKFLSLLTLTSWAVMQQQITRDAQDTTISNDIPCTVLRTPCCTTVHEKSENEKQEREDNILCKKVKIQKDARGQK